MAVTFPAASTLAIAGSLEDQVTVLSVASSGITLALRVSDSPTFRSAEVWLIEMLSAGVCTTLTMQVAVASPQRAVIVASPIEMAVTLPLASTVATVGLLEDQLIVLSVASAGRTVADSVSFSPAFRCAADWLRIMLVAGVGTTVTVQVAVTLPQRAVIVAEPREIAVTVPLELTVATAGLLDVQVTVLSVASAGITVASRVTVSPTFNSAAV